jgi:cytochrome b
LVFFLVVGHILAVVFYRIWKRENLVDAMVTGFKQVRKDDPNA